MSTSRLQAIADSLTDRLARLDELFAKAGHLGATSLQPLLETLQVQAATRAQSLTAACRDGSAVQALAALKQAAETVGQLHARLDLVPGAQTPAETAWLLSDWLGSATKDWMPPPVLLTLDSRAHATFLPDSLLCSLYLPLAERENPLAWTLLAHGLGQWVNAALGLLDNGPDGAMHHWLLTHLADRLALRMVGPAYVFALAYGEPERWFDPASQGPSLVRRLRWTLADAKAAGFAHPQLDAVAALVETMAETSEDMAAPAGFDAADEVLARSFRDITLLPTYMPAAFATAEAMVPDLREGLPISARPRLPHADQVEALQTFKAQSGYQPGTAASLLALFKDQANDAATILNAGWLYRNELRAGWLDELKEAQDGAAVLRHARLRGGHLDRLLQKSLETATIHRLLQGTTP